MSKDRDIAIFLKYSGVHMDVNALGPDWELAFVRAIDGLKDASIKSQFKRGFAKAVLGELSPADYEQATRWDFDTKEDFLSHLRKYWAVFYGSDNPRDGLR